MTMAETDTPSPVLSIVIPLYCESVHVSVLLDELQKHLGKLKVSYELILVDDGSPDNTWEVIQTYFQRAPMLRAVRLSRNFGKESALCAGLEMSRGKAVIVMDGDLQHPPHLILDMFKAWHESHADVVEAVKEHRGLEPFSKKLGAVMFYGILNKLSGYDLKGMTDYKLMDRRVVQAWLRMRERSLFFRGMSAWLGFKRVTISFTVPPRAAGHSRWPLLRLVRLALNSITAFSSMPLHFITLAGIIFFAFGFILGIQTLYIKLTGRSASGFTTVIILLLIIGSVLMIALGIIGEYISRIYEEVKQRPRYVIAKRIDRYDLPGVPPDVPREVSVSSSMERSPKEKS